MKEELISCDDTYFTSSEIKLNWDNTTNLKCCYLKVQPQMGDRQTVVLRPEEFIKPVENDGQSTIELMEYQEGKLGLQSIWDNSFDSVRERKQNE